MVVHANIKKSKYSNEAVTNKCFLEIQCAQKQPSYKKGVALFKMKKKL